MELTRYPPKLDWVAVAAHFTSPERIPDLLLRLQRVLNIPFEEIRKAEHCHTFRSSQFGIFVRFTAKKVEIQFQGAFLILPRSLDLLRRILAQLRREFDLTPFYVTRVDVAIDFIGADIRKLLPDPNHPDVFYSWARSKTRAMHHSVGKEYTGFSLKAERVILRPYRKDIELRREDHERKRAHYEQKFPPSTAVWRIELQLSNSASRSCLVATSLLSGACAEEAFCKTLLREFGRTHSVRKRPRKSTCDVAKRWPVVRFWEELLFMKQGCAQSAPELPVAKPRFAQPHRDIEKLLEEALVSGRLQGFTARKLAIKILKMETAALKKSEETVSEYEKTLVWLYSLIEGSAEPDSTSSNGFDMADIADDEEESELPPQSKGVA